MTKEFEVFMKIVNEDLPDPRTIYPGVSAHMCAIIAKATARDVNERFQSCDEFIKGLKDTSIGHSYGISESVLENETQHAKGNDEVKNVLDKPTSASKPQANKSGSEHSAGNDKTRTAEYSQVLPSAKNKQFKTVGFIAAGILLIGLLVYFLVPTEKQTNAKVLKEKEVLETTVVPIASAEQVKTTNPSVLEGNDFSGPPKNGTNTDSNPFGTGGTGGGNETGQGKLGGNGKGEGEGKEDGTNSGYGSGENRIRKNDPIFDKFKTDVDITINLKLIINSSGKVVSATNIASKTTTTDNRIINGVISEVMKQVKYDEKKNARDEYVYITCKIRAQ
jgi:hypothetical protein